MNNRYETINNTEAVISTAPVSFISYGNSFLFELQSYFDEHFTKDTHFVILDDNNTHNYCLNLLTKIIDNYCVDIITIEACENDKTIDTVISIWNKLLEYHCDRKTVMLLLGGGIVCDTGGFAASTFKRGISYISIPTTLLAQTDAAWGGKNGVNFNNIKNQIGLFNNPNLIAVNTSFLKTLPERQLKSGMAEIIKHAIIGDKSIFKYIEQTPKDDEYYKKLLIKSIAVKKSVIDVDFKENGKRKILNFGHTIGHAIEAAMLNKITHGEAIRLGMIAAIKISSEYFHFDINDYSKYIKIIEDNNSPTINKDDISLIMKIMKDDKKNYNGNINFVLMKDIENMVIDVPVSEDKIIKSLEFLTDYANK